MHPRVSNKQYASMGMTPPVRSSIPDALVSVEKDLAHGVGSLSAVNKHLAPCVITKIQALTALHKLDKRANSLVELKTIAAFILGYLERFKHHPDYTLAILTLDDLRASIAPVTPAPMLVHGGGLVAHHYGAPDGYPHPSVPSPSHVAPPLRTTHDSHHGIPPAPYHGVPMAHHDPGMYIESEYVMIAGRLVKISR